MVRCCAAGLGCAGFGVRGLGVLGSSGTGWALGSDFSVSPGWCTGSPGPYPLCSYPIF